MKRECTTTTQGYYIFSCCVALFFPAKHLKMDFAGLIHKWTLFLSHSYFSQRRTFLVGHWEVVFKAICKFTTAWMWNELDNCEDSSHSSSSSCCWWWWCLKGILEKRVQDQWSQRETHLIILKRKIESVLLWDALYESNTST